jgi:hypothetical protein
MKSDRIELLKKREAAIRVALAAEHVKLAKRNKRDNEKLHSIVGEACCNAAEKSPESFGLMLRQVLDATVVDAKARELLRRKGML